MIQVDVVIVTEPIQVEVNLNKRVGAVLTAINDTIDNNSTVIINDILD